MFSKNLIKKINEIKKNIIERFSFLNTKVDSVYQPETIKIQQHKMEFILSHLSFLNDLYKKNTSKILIITLIFLQNKKSFCSTSLGLDELIKSLIFDTGPKLKKKKTLSVPHK